MAGFDADEQWASSNVDSADWNYALAFVRTVCNLAGDAHLIDTVRDELHERRIIEAVRQHDTPKLFEWLVEAASFQGIADQVARGYIAQHGSAQWDVVRRAVSRRPRCYKLERYWTFAGCGYRKAAQSCANSERLPRCAVPALPLRNGSLSQMACSLFLFIRDIAGGDFVRWLSQQLESPGNSIDAEAISKARQAVIVPLRSVHGVSDKVLNMTLSGLLLSADNKRWRAVGASMLAVDTLVHNFLHRSGILKRCARPHAYGAACYAPGGCAELLWALAREIDAKAYHPRFPRYFPRFVQHAVWRFCAQERLDVCNGNRIDDRRSCHNDFCRLYGRCDKNPLRSTVI